MIAESWDGFKWFIESESDKVVLSKGELSVLRALSILPCSVFLDIGAHIGYYTVKLARRCNRVVAFEPNPVNRAKLLRNAELNGLTNVVVYPYACGEARYKKTCYATVRLPSIPHC
jgi:precorrin-6B methylase 2